MGAEATVRTGPLAEPALDATRTPPAAPLGGTASDGCGSGCGGVGSLPSGVGGRPSGLRVGGCVPVVAGCDGGWRGGVTESSASNIPIRLLLSNSAPVDKKAP